MTVMELCREYQCDYSSIYRKIKRRRDILDGHIKKSGSSLELDDYAVDILLPNRVKDREDHREKIAELQELLNEKSMECSKWESSCNEKSDKLIEAEREISGLKESLKISENRLADFEKTNSELSEKVTSLESENSELRKKRKRFFF